MTWNDYFELKWTSSLPENMVGGNPTSITRRFAMLMSEDSSHAGKRHLHGYAENLLGELMVINVPFRPRAVMGLVRIDDDDVLDPKGTRRDLEEAANATDLEAKMYDDAAFWHARWMRSWEPGHFDPLGEYWYIPMELRQVHA